MMGTIGEDRRASTRHRIQGARLTCALIDDPETVNLALELVDISSGGACVVVTGNLPLGVRTILDISIPKRSARFEAVGTIMWKRDASTPQQLQFLTGIRFDATTVTAGTSLEELLGITGTKVRRPAPEAESPEDRRQHLRMSVEAEDVVCVPKGLAQAMDLSLEKTSMLLDISRGGARLKTTTVLDIGQTVHIRLRVPRVGQILEVDGVVMWFEEKSDSLGKPACYVGVQFSAVSGSAMKTIENLEQWYENRD